MARPDFPRSLAEFQARFASDEACRRYLVACRWPDGFRCPAMRRRRQLPPGHARPAAMPGVPAPDLGDGRHRPGPHPAAPAALVRGRLPGHHPHAGVLGVAAAAPARARALRDGVDDAAEAAPRHGAARARPALGHGGAGRDLRRWRRGRAARRPAARQQEVDPGRRGRGPRPRLRTDQARGRGRPLGRHVRPLRRGNDRAGQHGADRWLAFLSAPCAGATSTGRP